MCLWGNVSGDVVGEEAGRAVLVVGAPQTSLGRRGPLLTNSVSANLLDSDRSLLPGEGVSSPSLKLFR